MAEKNILSKPTSITLGSTIPGRPSSRYIYYTEVKGKQEGNNFTPTEGKTSAEVNVYRKISESEYIALESSGSNLIKKIPASENNGEDLYLANDAIIINNEIFPTQIAPDNVQRFSSQLKPSLIDGTNQSITDSGLTNNANLSPNTAPPQNQQTTSTPINIPTSQPDLKRSASLIKTYPIDMAPAQDRMEFSVWQYSNRGNTDASSVNILSIGAPEFSQVPNTGFVYLPVTKISDTNSVNWQEDGLNELQKGLANLSYRAMGGANNANAIDARNDLTDQGRALLGMISSAQFGNLARLYLSSQAIGVNNLLTRATGAILNPNLELLFNGPILRQFGFGFDLLSKSEGEAERVKEIINFFKKNMAVRDSGGLADIAEGIVDGATKNLFLNSPYVFKIRYLAGGAGEHKSIGKIKMCALQSCNVDYTPMGSYMTFKDGTMFMYRLNLQFKELTPIYSSDYTADHPIGF
jgi:hypothetical protein